MNVTERLAHFAVEFDLTSAHSDVVDAAKVMILDGLGVMIAAADHPAVQILRAHVDESGQRGSSTVVGSKRRTSPSMAALVNGAALHVQDFEIQGPRYGAHGTSNILPPALALAEQRGIVDGKKLLEAVIVGWEIHSRLRMAGPVGLFGFHPPGVIGPMSGAAASGTMLELEVPEMTMAYGIAATHAGSLMANRGTFVKSFHAGNAGRHGVEAALLAQRGFQSHEDIFGSIHGYISTIFRGHFDESALNGMESARNLVDPGFHIKRYPAEVWMQRIIEAITNIPERERLNPEEIDFVEVEMSHLGADPKPEVTRQLSRPSPKSGLDGKFSFQYCAAVALTRAQVDIDAFTDVALASPTVQLVLPKVRAKFNSEIPESQLDTWVIARVGLRNGEVRESRCSAWKGHVRNPMTRDDRIAKFKMCTSRMLRPDETVRAIDAVDQLEEPGSLAQILRVVQSVRPELAGPRS